MYRRTRDSGRLCFYALVVVADSAPGSHRAVTATLRRGGERVWHATETVSSPDPVHAAMVGVWRVLGEALRHGVRRLEVFVSEPDAVRMLEREAKVGPDYVRWYLTIRSRCNEIGHVRFVACGLPGRPSHPQPKEGEPAEPSLFGAAVA